MNKFLLIAILIIVSAVFLLILMNGVLAEKHGERFDANYNTKGDGIPNPIGTKSFTELLTKIIGYLILIGAPILAIMVIYGGFFILTAGGNPEKFKTGKDIILYAVIGYIIILVSWGIIYIIGEILMKPDLIKKI